MSPSCDRTTPTGAGRLWLPDVVCGAVLAAYRGDGRYLRPMIHQVTTVEIDAA